jgi:hypothetical protein
MVDVIIPPTIGAAIGFMTYEPLALSAWYGISALPTEKNLPNQPCVGAPNRRGSALRSQ